MKRALLLGAVTLALAGCAAGPYYDSYGYGYGPGPGIYDSGYSDYGYGAPAYYGPSSLGVGYYYYESDGRRYWRDGRRDHDGNWRDRGDRWRDRGDGWDRGDRVPRPAEQMVNPRGFHGESGNEAGMGRGNSQQ
ncbi:MAG: hypothetical protein ABIS17_10980 [Casimicrobiaceae bacterium]